MSTQHVAALARARKRIVRRKEDFVCLAINNIKWADDIDLELRRWIADSIYPHVIINSWLAERGFKLTAAQRREYRLLWIEQMIPIVKEWK